MLKVCYCGINRLITLKVSLRKLEGWTSNGTGASEVVECPSLATVSVCLVAVDGLAWALCGAQSPWHCKAAAGGASWPCPQVFAFLSLL